MRQLRGDYERTLDTIYELETQVRRLNNVEDVNEQTQTTAEKRDRVVHDRCSEDKQYPLSSDKLSKVLEEERRGADVLHTGWCAGVLAAERETAVQKLEMELSGAKDENQP
ncbi:hypothetical protein PC129_g3262 [Phytophthora cactorum]|uniref:Uncharacterized protein n=1 Tax=Phytophthora cactorum TaxID=29920 RepID=A0A8T1DD67_9STRA|nr:hypothetical protein PC113_g4575 [Phytophthora cactorum]KAG2937769.1 hypothetical protein PC115_g4051 [Phytophthora cactorum]KAG2993354.1 hypothetical protein PC118_g4058 [Phytophthora cactorum]KAG3098048.1 hypothetical protein PC122_g4235 [Phytophthora cactorum]KAG3226162.1 hypothetical protein PC129_g3262 [Phytophthora cactorum]